MDWDKDPLAGACTQGLWDLHITLVCVHSVKQGLRGHPLDRQAALEGEEGGQWVPGTPLGPACCPRPLPPSQCWFSCSSQCGARLGPARSLRSSSRYPQSQAHYAQPGPGGCTAGKAGHGTRLRFAATRQEPRMQAAGRLSESGPEDQGWTPGWEPLKPGGEPQA